MLTHGIPPDVHSGVHIFLPAPNTIGSVSSLSCHAIAYRWRSLSRVRWHRASSPQGSSSKGCCLCITTDQMLSCSAFFSYIHYYWYEVYQNISTAVLFCGMVSPPPTYSAYWLPTRKKLLYTVANPARGLLNREKRAIGKVWQHTPSPHTPHYSFGEK